MDVWNCQDKATWRVEGLFPHLDAFIRSARLVTAGNTGRIWVRVWPGIAFCAIHAERELLPGGTCLRRPLSSAQAWAAFLDANDGNDQLLEPLRRLRSPCGPTMPADLIGGDYLLDDPEVAIYLPHACGFAQAESAVLGYLDTALQELNQRIVTALGIESWGSQAEALLRQLGLDSPDMAAHDHDRLVSAISSRWNLIAPYLANATSADDRTSGPAMLYLIAICSACAEGQSSMTADQAWTNAMLDSTVASPHGRLLQAISRASHRQSIVRTASRLGGRTVRILARTHEPHRAFKQCLDGLRSLGKTGSAFDETCVRDIDAAEPRWRHWPARILRLAISQAMTRRGTTDYERMLAAELSCVAEAIENGKIDVDRLPANVGWPGIVSTASHMQWSSDLPAYCDSGYEIWPLLTTSELQEEGRTMQNCAKEYDLLCAGEIARVFSIRDPGNSRRIATALIMRDGPDLSWKLSQVKAPLNLPVTLFIHDLASRIARFYNLNETGTASIDRLGMMDKAAAKMTQMSVGGQLIE